MIVLDAMGGDFAPKEAVAGALEALPHLHYPLTLVGDTEAIQALLPEHFNSSQIQLCHASEVITMEDKPVAAIRQKKQSSIAIGIDLITSGQAQIFVSAGNTGAVAAASLLSWRQMSGIHRPALVSVMPNLYEGFVLLDVGASPDIQPQHLIDFAIMGRSYAETVLKRYNPRVHLLNIGEEEGKGNAFAKQAYHLLSKYPWFAGNIESKDAFHQHCDVILCDAFVGNIFLKTCEGVAEMMFKMIKDQVPKNPLLKLFYLPLKKVMKPISKKGDYAEQGGSPLLGLNNISIICHGRSNAKAIKNALLLAQKAIDGRLLENIRRNIKKGSH